MIVYVSAGNSDDKLTQLEWHQFVSDLQNALSPHQPGIRTRHGAWVSRSDDRWQNAAWCVEIFPDTAADGIRTKLRDLAEIYRQDAISWAVAPFTEWLTPPLEALPTEEQKRDWFGNSKS